MNNLTAKKVMDYSKPILTDGFPILPMVLFTEDDWNTIYEGCCVQSTFYSYLVRSYNYGTFWIPKINVKLKHSISNDSNQTIKAENI